MSKLGDVIRRSQRIESTPMGFGAARPAAKPSMLVGFLGAADKLEAAREAGAELVLVDARPPGLISKLVGGGQDVQADALRLRSSAGELPLGVWAAPDAEAAKRLKADGLDFLTFDPETTAAAALLDEDVGYVLALPASADELFLRSLEPLQLEAIFLGDVALPLTVVKQLETGRVSMLAHKPLICRVPATATDVDLQCLRGAGVAVVLVDSPDAVAAVKATVAAMPPRRIKREDRPVVSLPSRGATAPEEDDDDDDE